MKALIGGKGAKEKSFFGHQIPNGGSHEQVIYRIGFADSVPVVQPASSSTAEKSLCTVWSTRLQLLAIGVSDAETFVRL